MRNPGGYYVRKDEAGIIRRELDSFTCIHCNRVVFVKPMCDPVEMGGRCSCCDDFVCKECVGKPCDHIERKLAREEAVKSYF